ncbi:MAG: glucose 1-dehydrogenase [Proteobacteria bacterium]|nr:glucose 1-dehydrogenase [Pseudomonadota bacterium]
MSLKFQDKVALVTGGGSGIGRATSLAFSNEGANIVVADINVTGGEETVAMIRDSGGEAVFFEADVSQEKDAEAMVGKAVSSYGRLDCAFNNAAHNSAIVPTAERTVEMFMRTISVDLIGVWLGMKYQILQFLKQGGGVIVNTASAAALGFPSPGASDYVAAKYGVVGLNRTAQLEYAKDGIRINVVCPGVIPTVMMKEYMASKPEVEKWLMDRTPAKRFGTPEDIAEAVIWLCSDSASFVYGSVQAVDGGMLLS